MMSRGQIDEVLEMFEQDVPEANEDGVAPPRVSLILVHVELDDGDGDPSEDLFCVPCAAGRSGFVQAAELFEDALGPRPPGLTFRTVGVIAEAFLREMTDVEYNAPSLADLDKSSIETVTGTFMVLMSDGHSETVVAARSIKDENTVNLSVTRHDGVTGVGQDPDADFMAAQAELLFAEQRSMDGR